MLDDRSTISHLDVTFPPATLSVRAARHEVENLLAGYPEDVQTTVVLLTSELASNAVVHGQTAFTVQVHADRSVVRVAICDSGGNLPAIAERGPTTLGGWGLSMVDAAANRWGIESNVTTTVWFEIDVP